MVFNRTPKGAVLPSSALGVCRARSAREQCLCRVHSTISSPVESTRQDSGASVECTRQESAAFVECSRQAMRLSSALDKQCVCRLHTTGNAFVERARQVVRVANALGQDSPWRTPKCADRHASVECYVFKVAYCVECSHADTDVWSQFTSNNLVLGVVPKQNIGAIGANIG